MRGEDEDRPTPPWWRRRELLWELPRLELAPELDRGMACGDACAGGEGRSELDVSTRPSSHSLQNPRLSVYLYGPTYLHVRRRRIYFGGNNLACL